MPSLGDTTTGSWDSAQNSYGASLAAPLVAGMLALVKQKYPAARGNQIVQSLIHNTTGSDHDLIRDTTNGFGYGPVSLSHLLAVDPAKYPDENPLMDKASGVPTAAQVKEFATTASPTPRPSATALANTGGDKVQPSGSWLIVALVGVAVAIVVVAVLIIVVVSMRRTKTRGGMV
jgi:subtilisin family serine protease